MSDKDSGCWRVITRVGVVVGIIAALITIVGVVHGFSPRSPNTAGSTTDQPTQQARGPSPTSVPLAPTNTPLPPQPGTVLYQANWSSGSAGWSAGGPWKVLNGTLLNDGTQWGAIFAPYAPTIRDYAAEASIQVQSQSRSPAFAVFARASSSGSYSVNGYVGGITGYLDADGYNDTAALGIDSLNCFGTPGCIPYSPDSGWHTYRIEVKGNSIKVLIDGGYILGLTDNQYLDPGRVGLTCRDAQIAVQSFTVTAL